MTPLPPRKHPMKRTPLSRRKKPAKAARERYCDSKGIPFDEANSWFPGRVPVKKKDVEDAEVCEMFHNTYEWCWLCECDWTIEAHHVVSRSDEPCNIVMLCQGCHTKVQHDPKALPRVLLAKWTHDKMHADWRRIIELRGRKFLFDTLSEQPQP